MNQVKNISYPELQTLLKSDTILIDIREPDEHKIAHIPGSINIPKDLFTQILLNNLSNENIVIYCRSGNRCSMLLQSLKLNDNQKVYHLSGGISGLADVKFNKTKKSLPIMQQVQITIGIFIIASYILAFSINYNFIYVPILLGCGLIFAGISGFCGLAKLLSKMPWNK